MFERDYNFKGKHATIVTQLTTELDSEMKFKLFDRNIDVFILAPIIGFLYGRRASVDSGGASSDNVKKINFDQMNRESYTLNYNYRLLMLLHDKEKIDIEERLNRAFRYFGDDEKRKECEMLFESYILGGIEVLKEKIIDNATSIDDYVMNIFTFMKEFNDKSNNSESLTDEQILDLCRSVEV